MSEQPILLHTKMQQSANQVKLTTPLYYILLSIGPILLNIALITIFNLNAAFSMFLVVFLMSFILRKGINLLEMFKNALDIKLHSSIFGIIFFQQMLLATGIIDEITKLFGSSFLSLPIMLSLFAIIIGMLTGASQGTIAIVFPIITAMAPGNLSIVTLGLITGLAGQMLSPAHLCLIVSVNYFKANLTKALLPIFIMETLMLFIGILGLYFI